MHIEKVKQIAQEKYGKTLTDEQAAKYAKKYGKLSDSEIDSVSGGYECSDVELWFGKECETCGVWCDDYGKYYTCPVCGKRYE